jgi:hypothetical protein
MGGDAVAEPVRAHGLGPVHIGLHAQIDGRIAHNQGLAFEIAPAQITQIEQQGRHDRGDDRAIQIAKVEPFEHKQLAKPHTILVGGACDLRYRPPLSARLVALINGKNDIGVSGINGEQHQGKNTSPAAMARGRPCP